MYRPCSQSALVLHAGLSKQGSSQSIGQTSSRRIETVQGAGAAMNPAQIMGRIHAGCSVADLVLCLLLAALQARL
jgi:hypothetical protein